MIAEQTRWLGAGSLNSVVGEVRGWMEGNRTSMARFAASWHYHIMHATLLMGRQGRLVIPAEVRKALGLSPGDYLHLRLVGRSLVLERQQDAAAELRGLASQVSRTRSLVQELLDERRAEAALGE